MPVQAAALFVLKKIGADYAAGKIKSAFRNVAGLDLSSRVVAHAAAHFSQPKLKPLLYGWITSDEFKQLAAQAYVNTLENVSDVHAALDTQIKLAAIGPLITGADLTTVLFDRWKELILADHDGIRTLDAFEQARFEALRDLLMRIEGRLPRQVDTIAADPIGDLDATEKALELQLELDPRNAGAHADLAVIALARGEQMSARKYAEEACRLVPENPRFRCIYAMTLAQGRLDDAVRVLGGKIDWIAAGNPRLHEGRPEAADIADPRERRLFETLSSLHDYLANASKAWSRTPYRIIEELFAPSATDLRSMYVPLRFARGDESRSESRSWTIAELATGRRVLIVGAAGAGKSTLLRTLALRAWDDPGSMGFTPHIPVLVQAQHLAAAAAGATSDEEWLLGAMFRSDSHFRASDSPFLQWASETGAPWMLLVDGLELVSADQRRPLLERLAATANRLPVGATVIVTARPDVLRLLGRVPFEVASIEPFQPEQVEEIAKRLLGEDASAFIASLRPRALEAMMWGPLLLTIVAGLFRRGMSVGAMTRGRIYAACIAAIEQEHRTGLTSALEPRLANHINPLLDITAIAIMFPVGDVEMLAAVVTRYLAQRLDIDASAAQELAWQWLTALARESGYFEFHEGGSEYEWLHPSLHAALAARAMTRIGKADDNLIAGLAQWGDLWWHDALLFAAELQLETAKEHEAIDLCKRLLVTANGDALLEIACIDGVILPKALDETLIDRFAARLRALPMLQTLAIGILVSPYSSRALRGLAARNGAKVREVARALLIDPSVDPAVRGEAGELLAAIGALDDLAAVATSASVEGYVRVACAATLGVFERQDESRDLLQQLAEDPQLRLWEQESALHAVDFIDTSDRNFYRARFIGGDGGAQVLLSEMDQTRNIVRIIWPEVALALREWESLAAEAMLPDTPMRLRLRVDVIRIHVTGSLWSALTFGIPVEPLDSDDLAGIGVRFKSMLQEILGVDVREEMDGEAFFRRLYGRMLDYMATLEVVTMGIRRESLRVLRRLLGAEHVDRTIDGLPADSQLRRFIDRYGRNDDAPGGMRTMTAPAAIAEATMQAYFSRGAMRELRGANDEAIADFTLVVEGAENPELRNEARERRGRLRWNAESAAAYDDYQTLSDDSSVSGGARIEAWMILAAKAAQERDWQSVKDYSQKALTSGLPDLNVPHWYRTLGMACHGLGELNEAIEAYTKGIELDGDANSMRVARGRLHDAVGDEESALADLTAVLDSESASPDDRQKAASYRAEINQRREDWTAAISDYTTALEGLKEGSGDWMQLMLRRADLLALHGDRREARAAYERMRAFTRDEHDRQMLDIRIASTMEASEFVTSSGASEFGQANELGSVLLYATQMAKAGHLSLALAAVDRFIAATSDDPQRGTALIIRAMLCEESGRLEEAVSAYEAAAPNLVTKIEEWARSMFKRAHLLERLSRHDDAIAVNLAIVSFDGATPEMRLLAAAGAMPILLAQQRHGEAIAAFRPAITGGDPTVQAIAHMSVARIRGEAGQYVLAVDELNQALGSGGLPPESRPQALHFRAKWRLSLGLHAAAIDDLEQLCREPAATTAEIYEARLTIAETKSELDVDGTADYLAAAALPGVSVIERSKAHTGAAFSYLNAGDVASFLSELREALREPFPLSGHVRRLLAMKLLELGDCDQAVAECSHAVTDMNRDGLRGWFAELDQAMPEDEERKRAVAAMRALVHHAIGRAEEHGPHAET